MTKWDVFEIRLVEHYALHLCAKKLYETGKELCISIICLAYCIALGYFRLKSISACQGYCHLSFNCHLTDDTNICSKIVCNQLQSSVMNEILSTRNPAIATKSRPYRLRAKHSVRIP